VSSSAAHVERIIWTGSAEEGGDQGLDCDAVAIYWCTIMFAGFRVEK
jgi:hypothetical protein